MQLKSFTAATVAEAMKLVRDHFGEDAIIVSTRRDSDAGGVRITAAVDDGAAIAPDDRAAQADARDAVDAVAQALEYHALPAGLTDRLIGICSNVAVDDPASSLALALDAAFVFEPLPIIDAPRPLLFCGPPGAGKTVTCAKIATRAALAEAPVHLIAADSARAGGFEQLNAFAKLLNAPCSRAESAEDAREAVRDAHLGDLVLIDAPAANPFAESDMAAMAELGRETGAEMILILPAGGHVRESEEIAMAFREAGCQRLLATKLDAARRMGGVLAAAASAKLKLCDLCAGPHAHVGLTPASPLALARLLLPDVSAPRRSARREP